MTTASSPNLFMRLVVRFADGREASYTLEPGHYQIGSSDSCQITIKEDAVAPFHGVLQVEGGNVFLVNLQPAETIILVNSPVTQRTQLVVGDTIHIGEVSLQLTWARGAADVEQLRTRDGTVPLRRRIDRGFLMSTAAYREFTALFAQVVSPDEAACAQRDFKRRMVYFGLSVLGYLLLLSLMPQFVATGWMPLAAFYEDFLTALALIGTLWLVSGVGVSCAGRVLIVLGALLVVLAEPPDMDWNSFFWYSSGIVIVCLPAAYVLGVLIDYGASTRLGRSHQERRRWTLLAVGLFFAVASIAAYWTDSSVDVFPVLTLLASIACMAWGWWPGRRLAMRREDCVPDEETVIHAAEIRWWRMIVGRSLAILLAFVPFFMFLKTLGLEQRLAWPSSDEAVLTELPDGESVAWFWTIRGRFLDAEDLRNSLIFGFNSETITEEDYLAIDEHIALLDVDQASEQAQESYASLLDRLGKYRLRTEQDFQACVGDEKAETYYLLYLQQTRTSSSRSHPQGATISHAGLLDDTVLIQLTESRCGTLTWSARVIAYPMFGLLLFGFLVLWRRGGDSPLGRWIGLWLLAVTYLGLWAMSDTYFPSVIYQLWEAAVSSPTAAEFMGLLVSLDVINKCLAILAFSTIPQAAIWVHLCWPPRGPGGWRRRFAAGGKILLVALLLNIIGLPIFAVIEIGNSVLSMDVALTDDQVMILGMTVTNVVNITLLLVVGYVLRRSTARFSEVPWLGWMPPTAFVLVLLAINVLAIAEVEWRGGPCVRNVLAWVGIVAVVAFFGLAAYIAIRGGFLRLWATRDMSTVVLVAVLPVAFEYSEMLAEDLLTRTGLFTQRATQILSILIVLGLAGPLWKLLQRMFVRLSVPTFRAIEVSVADALETIIDNAEKTDPRAEVARLFDEWSASSYAFYSRTSGGDFDVALSYMENRLPDRLAISKPLRDHLCAKARFLDLESALLEWRHFFCQFELYRIQEQTGCRYLLPLCLGPSLRGLLLLPEGAVEEGLSREVFTNMLSTLGLEVVRTREGRREDT